MWKIFKLILNPAQKFDYISVGKKTLHRLKINKIKTLIVGFISFFSIEIQTVIKIRNSISFQLCQTVVGWLTNHKLRVIKDTARLCIICVCNTGQCFLKVCV